MSNVMLTTYGVDRIWKETDVSRSTCCVELNVPHELLITDGTDGMGNELETALMQWPCDCP